MTRDLDSSMQTCKRVPLIPGQNLTMDKLTILISYFANLFDGTKFNHPKSSHTKRDLGKFATLISDAISSVTELIGKHPKQHYARSLSDGNIDFKAAVAGDYSAPAASDRSFIGQVHANVKSIANSSSSGSRYYTGLAGVNLSQDRQVIIMLFWSIFAILALVFAVRLAQLFVSYVRNVHAMTTEKPSQQNYYSIDHFSLWNKLKKHLIYAPLGKKRHNREIQLSRAVNYGTLPSRIHTLLIVFFCTSNIGYCLMLDWSNPQKGAIYAELRGRSGILATVNLIPLVILASRNNLAIPLLRVSFDTFNLFHRWIGRLVALLSLVHFFAWLAAYKLAMGNKITSRIFDGNPFLDYGLLALVAIIILPIHSFSPLRHAFYETFLIIHRSLAFLAFLGIYVHLKMMNLPAWPAIMIATLLWMCERIWRIGRLICCNYSRAYGFTWATVEALPGEACRMTFQLPRHVTIRPGSHAYAYLPEISWWMNHPFSVAWTNIESEPPVAGHDLLPERPSTPSSLERQSVMNLMSHRPTSVSMIMVARTGMTRQIYNKARSSAGYKFNTRAALEGPYAGHDSMVSYGTVIMFAGGGGITHHLIQIRHLLAGARAETCATRRIVLVWSIKDVECMEWVKAWMNEILHMEGRREVLMIKVHVSKPSARVDASKSKPTLQIIQGRVNPGAVLDEVLPTRVGATMVSVCGPGALADEVRAAVRERNHLANLELNEESFTW
jgi:hypothetical protein